MAKVVKKQTIDGCTLTLNLHESVALLELLGNVGINKETLYKWTNNIRDAMIEVFGTDYDTIDDEHVNTTDETLYFNEDSCVLVEKMVQKLRGQ